MFVSVSKPALISSPVFAHRG